MRVEHNIENKEYNNELFACAAVMNNSFDRFTRILRPIEIIRVGRVDRDSRTGYPKLIPAKGRPFNDSFNIHLFDNYDECVEKFNSLIDKGLIQYNMQLEVMKAKLTEMQKYKM